MSETKEQRRERIYDNCFRFNGFLEAFIKKCDGLIAKSMVVYLIQIKEHLLDIVEEFKNE